MTGCHDSRRITPWSISSTKTGSLLSPMEVSFIFTFRLKPHSALPAIARHSLRSSFQPADPAAVLPRCQSLLLPVSLVCSSSSQESSFSPDTTFSRRQTRITCSFSTPVSFEPSKRGVRTWGVMLACSLGLLALFEGVAAAILHDCYRHLVHCGPLYRDTPPLFHDDKKPHAYLEKTQLHTWKFISWLHPQMRRNGHINSTWLHLEKSKAGLRCSCNKARVQGKTRRRRRGGSLQNSFSGNGSASPRK